MSTSAKSPSYPMQVLEQLQRLGNLPTPEDFWKIADRYSRLGEETPLPTDLDDWWDRAKLRNIATYLANLTIRTRRHDLQRTLALLGALALRATTHMLGEIEHEWVVNVIEAVEDWARGTLTLGGEEVLREAQAFEPEDEDSPQTEEVNENFPRLRYTPHDLACCCGAIDDDFAGRLENVFNWILQSLAMDEVVRLTFFPAAQLLPSLQVDSRVQQEIEAKHDLALANLIRAAQPTCPR